MNEGGHTKVALFQSKEIRKTIHVNEWWFSVVDVCAVLTESPDAGAYWRKLKQRLNEEGSEVVTNCHGLKLEAPDGKMRETDCANTETLFRIIRTIPSPKAEPFKRWLAKVGYERVQEIEDTELIFSMLGEAATTEIAKNRDAQGFPQNQKAAQQGGEVAGSARKDVEQKSGKKVVSKENFLGLGGEIGVISNGV
ncbi:Bro-N domain-containing protein [Candidatus Peregrinibacteria bacterium]|nr:Bro-N domain-containing protein [Candidatus Peregrinibacteria bacterium]